MESKKIDLGIEHSESDQCFITLNFDKQTEIPPQKKYPTEKIRIKTYEAFIIAAQNRTEVIVERDGYVSQDRFILNQRNGYSGYEYLPENKKICPHWGIEFKPIYKEYFLSKKIIFYKRIGLPPQGILPKQHIIKN